MTLLIVYLFIALFFSFLCSIMEAVLLSTPRTYLMAKQEEGKSWAITFVKLKENIDKPLSAILSLNTVAHTVGAAGVGAQATKVFGETYFGVVSAILTLLILVVTEIIPKTIGASQWKKLGNFTTKIIRIMIVITYPLVVLSAFITRLISNKESEQSTSREEISALTSIGKSEGIFTEEEQLIIQNFLQLKDVKVNEIMTPRVVVAMANENWDLKSFSLRKDYIMFSRIPIYAENEENITGYVFRREVFEKLAQGKNTLHLRDLKRDIVIVPDSVPIFSVWNILREKKEYIALVVDEYGGIDGIVTMEDVVETLLGLEIVDEKDTIADMRKYARERWKTRQEKYKLIYRISRETENKSSDKEKQ